MKIISENRKARFDYFIESTFEAGIVLTGTEIKSVRKNNVNLRDSYVGERNGELWLYNAHIAEYDHGNINNHRPTRERKLLLNRKEINKITKEKQLEGYTIVPTKMYLKGQYAKVEIALAKGKKNYDKRETIKERDILRSIKKR